MKECRESGSILLFWVEEMSINEREVEYVARIAAERILEEVGEWLSSAPCPVGSVSFVLEDVAEEVALALEDLVEPVNRACAKPRRPQVSLEGQPHEESARRIRAIRQQLGLSQSRFARAIDTPEYAVYRWESGKGAPSYKSLQGINGLLKRHGVHGNILDDSIMSPCGVDYRSGEKRIVLTLLAEGVSSLVGQQTELG